MTEAKLVQAACRELRSLVLFESAGFYLPGHYLNEIKEDTDIIREVTRLYTETWILPILDAIESGDTKRLRAILAEA